MSEFTPGPWEFVDTNHGYQIVMPYHVVVEEWQRGRLVAKEVETRYGASAATEADARLIAAAPDLLAACEAGMLDSPFVDGPDLLHQAAAACEKHGYNGLADWLRNKAETERAAIAKARRED